MKLISTLFRTLLLLFALVGGVNQALHAQCTNADQWPFATVTAPTGVTATTINTCNYGGEYSVIGSVANGATYTFTSSVATDYITVRVGSAAGPVLGTPGVTPVTVTTTSTSNLYVHWNSSAAPACGAQQNCRTTTITCTSCAPPPAPANDLCANATAVAIPSGPTTFIMNGATSTGEAIFAPCGSPTIFAGSGAPGTVPGVFFSLNAPVGNGENNFTISTGSVSSDDFETDTELRLYSGTCAVPVCRGGDSDSGPGFTSLATATTTAATGSNLLALVTKYSSASTFANFSLSTAQLASITNIAVGAQSACDANTNLYTQTLTVTYLAAPVGANLVINGQTFAVTTSPQTVTLTGLVSNGLPVNVTAQFSGNALSEVTINNLFTAPARCNFCTPNCSAAATSATLAPGECATSFDFNVTTSGPCTQPAFSVGFEDLYAPSNWTKTTPGDGSIDDSTAPDYITIFGYGASATQTYVRYTTTVATTGTISFNWSSVTPDGPFYDRFGYFLNGTFVQLTNNAGANLQQGTRSVNVVAGDVFALATFSDNFGANVAQVWNFVAPLPPTPCEPTYTADIDGNGTQDVVTESVTEFAPGTYTVTASVGCNGDTRSCTFPVSVLGYPNPLASLICNDNVQISLDETCQLVLNADQILEGGPYGCYDDFVITIDKTLPYTAFTSPNLLTSADIGKTYGVKVTGTNGNSCWGTISIEDKIKPVLNCPDLEVVCGQPTTAGANAVQRFSFSSPVVPILDGFIVSDVIDVNLPAGATVLGFTVDLDITHTLVSEIAATLTNAGGSSVVLFDFPSFSCSGNDVDATFSDNASTTNAQLISQCSGTVVPAIQGTYQAASPLAGLLGGTLNGDWEIAFADNGAGDTGNGTVTLNFIVSAPLPSVVATDNCDVAVNVTSIQISETSSCAGGTVVRKYTATDDSGNTATCLQTVSLITPTLDEVTLPGDYTVSCDAASVNPPVVTLYGAALNPDICNLAATYTDLTIEICDGTTKTLRTWEIIDWCTLETIEHKQLIKVSDAAGPSIACPANMTVTTDPYDCCAVVELPDVVITDNCSRVNNIGGMVTTNIDAPPGSEINSEMLPIGGTLGTFPGNNLWNPDTLAQFGLTSCLPLGTHRVTYVAEDDCGNSNSCNFNITVVDRTPPVAVCDEFTVVAIGLDDPFDCYAPNTQPGDCSSGGVTWVKATTFDDGSYDNCGDVKFTVRRMVSPTVPLSQCILDLNQVNGFDVNGISPDGGAANCGDPFQDSPSEFERAVSDADSIKFYCCEVGTTQTVILSVIQLNQDGSVSYGTDGQPIKNECMVQVEVQDKIKPACKAPLNVTVTCELFDPSLWAYGNAVPSDNCCLDTTKVFQGQCGLTNTVNYSQFDSLCNKGTITRNWTSYDCHGQTSTCSQKVIVTPNQNYYVKFPADKAVSVCDGSTTFGEPTFFGEDCELLATSFVDEIFTVVPDACFKIERTWTVINWCTYTPNSTCIFVPNPDATTGPTVSAPGNNIANWAPTSTLVNGANLNYGTVWNANANCYKYKQIIKVIDVQDPTVVTPAGAEYCDYSTNDANYWNAAYWWDGPIESHNMCEGDADIAITATDACSGANISFRYLLFLDLDGNGTMETVVPGSPLPQVYNEVRFNNANTPLYAGGEPRAFDFRAVPANQKWGFGLQVDAANGNNRTAHVSWVNQAGNNAVPQLPYGTHKIKWFVEDGCGNETVSETTLVVKDCKKPTVVCVNGLSINQMNGPMNTVTLWASDFLVYGEDNCTPSNLLKYGIRKSGTGTGFPTVNGAAQTSVTFGCTELGTQLVELWAEDKAGNADFCETYVLVQDNTGACGTTGMASVAGALKTEDVEGVEDANVELDGSSNGLPTTAIFTNVSGTYAFNNALPLAANATVTPNLDVDPLNGVNTWDLVLISRHILGLEPLSSPYKLISADANKSGTVTTFDIVELRKLILGTYNALPNNSSWRFVDKSQQFTDNANPFADVIRENLQIANIQTSVSNGDFVAAKIGDVDGTATPNNLVSSDDRTAGTLLFDVTDRKVVAGEEFTVNFKAAEKVAGYQFTMNFNGLEVLDIVPGAGMTTENFGVFADAITTSADATEGEFAVTFRAATAGQLSNMLGVSSRITKAVAFDGNNKLDVAFRYNNGGVSTIAGVGFELYQNAPNPFVNKTVVGFHLPEAAEATLSVYDETGRVLYTTTGNFAKGYNAVSLERGVLNANGVLYYKLETVANSATKKMIQSK